MEPQNTQTDTLPTNKFPFVPVVTSVILTALIVGGVIFGWSNQRQSELRDEIASLNNQLQQTLSIPKTETPPTPAAKAVNTSDLSGVFNLSKKESGTEIYYSEKLGVGFTFLANDAISPVEVKESGNVITVADQTIEVFTKEANVSLEQAIKDKFLQGYNPSDCFVKIYETNEQDLANYVAAGISFPPSDDPDEPWWGNSDKCPQDYSETNAIQYFLMNKDIPEKFLFVKIGQYSATSDGTPHTTDDSFNWSHSIQILK